MNIKNILVGFILAFAISCGAQAQTPPAAATTTAVVQSQIQRDVEQRQQTDDAENASARARDIAAYNGDSTDAASSTVTAQQTREAQRLADERKDILENAQYVAKKFCGKSISCRKKTIQQIMDQYDASQPSIDQLQYEEQIQAAQLELQQRLNSTPPCALHDANSVC